MKNIFIIFLVLFTQHAIGQHMRYDSLVRIAERALYEKDYGKSAEMYQAALKSLNYKGFAPDRFNAAKAMAMSGNFDSAFVYLNILWNKTEYIEIDSLLNEKLLNPLRKDSRWNQLMIETTPRKPELAKQLSAIRLSDQENRKRVKEMLQKYGKDSEEYKSLWVKINLQDSLNQLEVFAILDKYGWLGRQDIGNSGCSALFLVIQHAPIEAQEKYLPIMRAAVKEGKARKQNLAYLEDRVLVRRDKKQLYGSQFKGIGNSYFPIHDIEHLNERREYVGLAPFSKEELAEIKRQSLGWK